MRVFGFIVFASMIFSGCAVTANSDLSDREVAIEQTLSIRETVDRAFAYAEDVGTKRVLVVFDIDSTLLRNPNDLGGNGWGGWQKAMMATDEGEPGQVATTRAHFLAIERALMYLSPLLPTEDGLADQLRRLREAGIASYALTARGVDMRDMTLRELALNQLEFFGHPECGPPLCVSRGVIPAEQVFTAARQVLGDRELKRLEFEKGRKVSVGNGVVMASGLDKGVMLRVLLASLERRFDAVVFIDDAGKNVVNVQRVSRYMPQKLSIFEYTGPHEDHDVSRDDKRQRDAAAAWDSVHSAICANLDSRWCDASLYD